MAGYIDREALIYAIKSVVVGEFIRDFKSVAIRIISEQPDAEVAEVRHGKWIGDNIGSMTYDNFKCSICGKYEETNNKSRLGKYCWNCGAKMDLGDD